MQDVGLKLTEMHVTVLGGSWVVISELIRKVGIITIIVAHIRGLLYPHL